jgi:hypothetical protein
VFGKVNLRGSLSFQDGKLYHTDIGLIWDKYPEDLRPWLLRLTEEFDLTFPSKDELANIVPCLLPANEPEVTNRLLSAPRGFRLLLHFFWFHS